MAQKSQLRALRALHIPAPRTRQQVFAFFYASGESAAEAARSARYAQSVWRSNPSSILKGKKVQILIERYRATFGAVSGEAAHKAVHHLMRLMAGMDTVASLIACKVMLRLYAEQQTLLHTLPSNHHETPDKNIK